MKRDGPASLPSVDRLISSPAGVALAERYGRGAVVDAVRAVLAEQRVRLSSGEETQGLDEAALLAQAAARIESLMRPSLRPVFNLTGTVLHTNLGRALYPQAAIDAAGRAMAGAVNLEYEIEGAARGERD